MSPMIQDSPATSNQNGFQLIQHNHRDMVTATAFNTYGTRFASSSVDGKVKVYNRHADGTWNLCDTWGAHNAEILQLQWLPPTLHPNLLASLSTDSKFKLWIEDPTIPLLQGRRFNPRSNRPIYELRSPIPRSPFTSFSLTYNPTTRHTYLALITRSALLILYENDEPENLENWIEIDRVNVCEKPSRGEETSFKVAFDPNLEPTYTAIKQGVPKDALGIVVASLNRVSVWRTKEINHNVSLGKSSTKELYLAAECKGHKGLVRDVAWAGGNMRGFDFIATACTDGWVRVFKISTPSTVPSPSQHMKGRNGGSGGGDSIRRHERNQFSRAPEQNVVIQQQPPASKSATAIASPQHPSPSTSTSTNQYSSPSGISTGLANTSSQSHPSPNSTSQPQTHSHARSNTYAHASSTSSTTTREGETPHSATQIAKLSLDEGKTPIWRVEFDPDGLVLGSTGDDGQVAIWRRTPDGGWGRSAILGMRRG